MSRLLPVLILAALASSSPAQVPDAPRPDARKTQSPRGLGPYLGTGAHGEFTPLSSSGKFGFAARNAFGLFTYPEVAIVAGIRQAANEQPSWGQGAEGYGKRYGAAFADQAIGNMLSQGVLPSLLKHDPRYFRMASGTAGARFRYAISRVWITRRDSGAYAPDVSQVLGAAMAAGVSDLYYPSTDRTAGGTAERWAVQVGLDAFWNEVYEFWPDIRRHLRK